MFFRRRTSPKPGKHNFLSTEGDPYTVKVPKASKRDSFFMFSFPRCGSTLLDRMLRQLCDGTKTPYLTIGDDAFAGGVQMGRIGSDIETLFSPHGYGYLGLRAFFSFDPTFDFSSVRKVLLVRDPRDMLVSLFFSMKHSHDIPKEGAASKRMQNYRDIVQQVDINDFLDTPQGDLAIKVFKNSVKRYQQFIFDEQLRVYHYEKVIFEKATWVKDLTEYLSIPASQALMDQVVADNDIVPDKENPHAHIRQVRPGNYLQHLSEASITRLNNDFAEELDFFGYPR